jgi:hypothetical protein
MTLGQILYELRATETENFTKSRAITLTKLNKSTSETPDAQLHMQINIPVMFA